MTNRTQRIEQLADRVRRACDLETPVDVEAAVIKLGGRLVPHNEADFEALIQKRDGGFEIRHQAEGYEPRRRFTIAHELGHLFLHMGYILDENKWAEEHSYQDSVFHRLGHNTEEHEANEFAAALLMPRAEFVHVANLNRHGDHFRIEPIAAHFEVSAEAAKMRGRWLGLFAWE